MIARDEHVRDVTRPLDTIAARSEAIDGLSDAIAEEINEAPRPARNIDQRLRAIDEPPATIDGQSCKATERPRGVAGHEREVASPERAMS
jgi:hypothetical protein